MNEDQSPLDYNIVLVDDDIDDQMIFTQTLNLNRQIQVFSSGSAALAYLQNLSREQHPQLIVLDYQMPGLNGLDVLKKLKENNTLYHIPVILYSSEINEWLEAQLKAYGAIKCFKKTIDLKEMKEYLQILGIVFKSSVFV
jgi:CheY-like chemotaxis protein